MSDVSQAAVRPPRWLYIGLIASLALNLLFVGGMAAAVWQHGPGRQGGGWRGDDTGLLGFVKQLPRERQESVGRDVKLAREGLKPLRTAIFDAWTAANASLAMDPFDKDKANASFQRATDAEAALKTAIANVLTDTAAKLTPEERRKMMDWREKRMPRKFRHRDKD